MYKAIVFDMDGTIVDTDMMIVLSYVEMYRKYRPTYKPSVKKLLSFSGPPLVDTFKAEFPDVPFDEALAFFRKTAKKYYDETVYAYPGLKEVLLKLKAAGIKTAIVTSKLHEETIYTLKITGLEGLFDAIVAGDDVAFHKPNPEGVNEVIRLFKIDNKEDVLYIGDTIYDYQTAANASVPCMLVTWTPRLLPPELKPRYFLDDWKDFFKVIAK